MPYVERAITVASDLKTVYEIAKDMENFPQYMPNIKEVKVVERDEDSTLTRWHGVLLGRDFRWVERDVFDDEKPAITYTQIQGDVKKFEGEWRFLPDGEGKVRLELTCDVELGLPMLDSLFNPVLKKAMEMNIDKMLHAIKEKVEG